MPSVNRIIEETEDLTKKKFRFVPHDRLGSHAIVKIARKSMNEHIIYYRTSNDDILNHIISHECGHIIRLFKAPESKRVMPYSGESHVKAFKESISEDLSKISSQFSFSQIEHLLSLWLNGIIMQISNQPVDIMIEKWLYEDHPDLREVQMRSIMKQWDDAKKILSPAYRNTTPDNIYTCVNLMNYAYFRQLGLNMGQNFIKPYNSTPFINKGKALSSILEQITNNDYSGDLEKINKWAEFLGVNDWFGWIDFETIPEGYEQSI